MRAVGHDSIGGESTSAAPRTNFDWPTALIIAIGTLAAAVRFYRLTGRSLWLDETVTAQSAHLSSPGEVLAQSQVYVNQAPFFYLITWLLRPWGDGEFILRLPAAVAGTLAVFAVYLIGRRLFGVRAALVAALLTAVMPYAVWYSQEARNYTIFMFFTVMQIYFAFNAAGRSRRLDWLGLALFTTLNLYTHYLALAATTGVLAYIGLVFIIDVLRGTRIRTKLITAGIFVVGAIAARLLPVRAIFRAAFLSAGPILTRAQLHPAYALAAGLAIALGLAVLGVVLRKQARKVKVAISASLFVSLLIVVRLAGLIPLGSHQGPVALPVAALVVTMALGLAIAVWLLALDLLQKRPELVQKLEWATVSGVLVGLAYGPWLPYLRLAISRPDVTLGQLHPTHQPGFQDIVNFLDRLGISGFLLLFFALGLVAIFAGIFRGHASESALLLCTLFVPAAVLVLSAGPAVVDLDIRYLAFLFPGMILVVAAGVEATAVLLAHALRRIRPRAWPNNKVLVGSATIVLVAAVLAQALPALAASYQIPKQDYRGGAEHIASSRPAPVLLSLGNYSDWSVITFGYYLHELHTPVAVIEGQEVSSRVASILANSTGTVWGVVVFPSAEQLRILTTPGPVQVDFVDATQKVYLVRTTDQGLTPIQQARELLRWEMAVEPRLRAVVKLLDLINGTGQLGPDLVSDPTAGAPGTNGWTLQPGVAIVGDLIDMSPSAVNSELNATTTVRVEPGADYVVSFEYLNDRLNGWQRVYASAIDQAGHEVSTFPGGGGFDCLPSVSWAQSSFAFTAPEKGDAVTLIFRTHGSGLAKFRGIHLNLISDLQ